MDVDGTARATHQLALNEAFTRQLRRVGTRNQHREVIHGDSARRHFYLSLCFEFSPYGPSFAPALTTRIAGGVILRDMSRATGSPRWLDKAPQSLAQFSSPMKQSSLNRVNGNSHDSSGLFRRSLVKLTQLECPPRSVRQLIQSREQHSLPLAL